MNSLKPCHPGISNIERYYGSVLIRLADRLKIDFRKLKINHDGTVIKLLKTKSKIVGKVSNVDVIMYIEETFWRLEFNYTSIDNLLLKISEKY